MFGTLFLALDIAIVTELSYFLAAAGCYDIMWSGYA